jgi:hypothetical protein
MGRRPPETLAGAVVFFGVDSALRRAHASFIASPIRLRAPALIVLVRGLACAERALGGRPRRACNDPAAPSRAAIA